ncbi:hypothetical protein M407DRAFT_242922 [Tulasnella calospora MUT 4182]|uniref:Uncharacterized protein n=1 Tax=Tulasnella calospora MUT 4182 TaxID=1051891 RepID=A0A0C3L4H6_9AGAM|nr:hypothetical protein M407DRAFT_242922 [Tulasnella calospora MUT 4182]
MTFLLDDHLLILVYSSLYDPSPLRPLPLSLSLSVHSSFWHRSICLCARTEKVQAEDATVLASIANSVSVRVMLVRLSTTPPSLL